MSNYKSIQAKLILIKEYIADFYYSYYQFIVKRCNYLLNIIICILNYLLMPHIY